MTLFHHVAHGTWSGLSPFSFSFWTTGGATTLASQGYWHTALGLLWAQIEDQYTNGVAITLSNTYAVTEATGRAFEKAVSTETLLGTDGVGALLPPQLAVVVSLRTGTLASRGLTGRTYLPGPSTSGLNTGELAAPNDYAAGAGALFTSLQADGLTPVLYQRKTHTTKQLTQYAIGNLLDTQRRRRDVLVETYTTGTI